MAHSGPHRSQRGAPGALPSIVRRELQAPRFQVPLGERASGLRSGEQESRRRHWVLLPKLSSGLVKLETKDFREGKRGQRVGASQANRQIIR